MFPEPQVFHKRIVFKPFITALLGLSGIALASSIQAQVPIHGTVLVDQIDANNTISSVDLSLSLGSSPSATIDPSRSNKGDFTLDMAPADDAADGVLIASVAENGRDNSAAGDPAGTFYPTAAIDITGNEYYIAITRSNPDASSTEFNINTSFAYFPYSDWLAGYARNSTNGGPITSLNASNGITLGSEFIDNGDGTYTLDLSGFGGTIDGVLLVSGGKNEDNYALSSNNGPVWTIYLHDNGENGVAYERDPVSFVYVSSFGVGSNGLVALGRVRSDGSSFSDGGNFTLNKQGTGVWHLSIPGASPDSGTLIVSPEGGVNFNVDNTVSAEYIGNETWEVQSRDLPGYNLQDGGDALEPMFSFAFFSKRIYVSSTATGSNDGSSWGSAFTTLQDALQAAEDDQEIWVAEGTYYPDEGNNQTNNNRGSSFALPSGVKIYGGFPDTGTATLSERDPDAHETILSGDIDQNDGADFANNGGNAYNILTADGVDAETLLDGFTITKANANSDTFPKNVGGGLLNINASALRVNSSIFRENDASEGAALFSFGSSPTLTNCVFQGNRANFGGAISSGNSSTTQLTNCTFVSNFGTNRGGAIFNGASMTLVNCSLQGNLSSLGGAISSGSGSISLTNCILWENAVSGSTTDPGASLNIFSGVADFSHSLVQNWTTAQLESLGTGSTGNLDGTDPANDPRFFAEVDPLAAPIATGGDLRLKASTPLLDRGTFLSGLPTTDLAGQPRFSNTNLEIGAYELKITYVDKSRTGGEFDGSSWFNAFDLLQEALKGAQPGDILFVAEGTYYPDRFVDAFDIFRDSDDRNAAFILKSGVEIYGGFPSGGTWADRNFESNETILSGDIDQNDGAAFTNNDNNAYHVLIANTLAAGAQLDGFTISGGNANVSTSTGRQGGGFYLINSGSIKVANCTFQGNSAGNSGGAIYVEKSSLALTDCAFQGNSGSYGGAVYNQEALLSLTHCSFEANGGNVGGAIYSTAFSDDVNAALSSSFIECTFTANTAVTYGGALFNDAFSAIVTNCSFVGNSSGQGGALYNDVRSSPSILNSSFQGNFADFGGAIYNYDESSPSIVNSSFQANAAASGGGAIYNVDSSPTLANCIIWNNAENDKTTGRGPSVFNFGGSAPDYTSSLIQNWSADALNASGANNLDGVDPLNNPRFVSESDPLSAPTTTVGDLRLFLGSPALDTGINNENDKPTDIAGNDRIQNATIDLGAYEGSVNDAALLWETDFDLDNRGYGIEIANGTDPDIADRDPLGSMVIQTFVEDGIPVQIPVLRFTRNPDASANYRIDVMRSTDLSPNSFVEIFRVFRNSASTPVDTEGGNQFSIGAETLVTFGDFDPPEGKAFYRFEVTYIDI